MTTAQKIRVFRTKRRMTQKRLGELCGMTDSAIRRYEAGRFHAKYETLQKIAGALEADVKELLPDNEPDFEIGSIIKRERKRLGITQEELAVRAKCSSIAIRQYETNTRTPRAEMLRRIANALNIDIDILFCAREDENGKPDEFGINLGQRIRRERERKQMTQDSLAAAIGVTSSVMSKYETGVIDISVKTLCLISDALQVSPYVFLDDTPMKNDALSDLARLLREWAMHWNV
ncbi:MAG: helix-turn-helix transcriptional regulator [Clostridia bacterium]|nr:helix-turn-helix transcriptional regulator [Clostridia bacterium]